MSDKEKMPDNSGDHGNTPKSVVGDIEFQVSQVIGRLEEAVEGRSGVTPAPPSLGPLPTRTAEDIYTQLESLLVEVTQEDGSTLPEPTGLSMLALVCHAVSVHAGSLDRGQLQQLSNRVTSDTSKWLSQLFRLGECGVCYHEDQLEGVVRVTRSLLHAKYPHYLQEGYEVMKTKPPVIYSNIASPLGIVQHICRQLGLPLHCVRAVPCTTLFAGHKMDVAALERLVEEDKSAGRLPLIVLADAGMPIAGHVDNLSRLQEVCRNHELWLHLRGHSLAALALTTTPNNTPRISDSATLPISTWLGVPGLPSITLYNPSGIAGAALLLDHPGRRLQALPLWAVLQNMGQTGIQQRIKEAFESSEQLWRRLIKYPCLRMLSQQPGGEGGVITIADIITKPVNTNLLFEVVASSVVFQFVPDGCQERVAPYYDKLNSWLGQILQRDSPQVPVELCELEHSGVVLRYCPLEAISVPSQSDIEAFVNCLDQQLEILVATVGHKDTFHRLVSSSPSLRLVEMPGWAGLGGVRYVPQGWETRVLTDQVKQELNKLNIQLVDRLRATDAAFSLGEGTDGLACVRFGMVTADTDVAELLSLVESVGKQEEDSWKFIDTMAEVVKKGIEAATLDLQRENEEKLWQEGILRQVPVFGSLVNWWSPSSKESGGVKGRSLDLTAGVVASTENIYKYHMQGVSGSSSGGKGPPEPLVQTPVAGHSRTPSVSSQQSNTNTAH
ncbi:pyridoxal-dependent decarboxylase domain-containing protein 1-like isoform X1 [Macrosteles quadrilineatus]|uniref:pyridoxal-dependent decarboxylase domain-containing protein 1-like isoform X1 n=2 Tax=Macrosteles quadrilineatus TaxID=74068 RepID=UPI0023E117F5|nr:pyridoxal-dependent decarboxylase domain-containing protein 1-like isoform X1 [Macrosteles quadrilineatus]